MQASCIYLSACMRRLRGVLEHPSTSLDTPLQVYTYHVTSASLDVHCCVCILGSFLWGICVLLLTLYLEERQVPGCISVGVCVCVRQALRFQRFSPSNATCVQACRRDLGNYLQQQFCVQLNPHDPYWLPH